jgi:cbb3-type cytochrome oxidase maturation protein
MSVMYIVLPLAIAIAGCAVLAYYWSVRSGQLDDLDTPPTRMLRDDMPRRVPLLMTGPTGKPGPRSTGLQCQSTPPKARPPTSGVATGSAPENT